jgi:cysteine desulfurase
MRTIYLDYAAATPLDKRVLAAMQPYFADQFYNPSSPYQLAKQVRGAVDDARVRVAHWLGAKTAEVIFTAGATESINQAITGVMRKHPDANVLVGATEHEAVLVAAKQFTNKLIPVKPDGATNLEELKKLINDKTVLVSVGYANNEIGTIQPVSEIAELLREVRQLRKLKNNQLPLYLHTDASQAACYLDLHASRLGADMITLNGGKMYGSKQTGVLYVNAHVELMPLVAGGGQEMGVRSGTENVAGIIGLATALDIAQTERKEAVKKASVLRDQLQAQLSRLSGTVVNGNQKRRLPNLLHVSWPGLDGERLVMMLDEQGLMASTGSACAANKQTASHVLKAIGLKNSLVAGSLRLSLGRQTTTKEITKAAEIITKAVQALG